MQLRGCGMWGRDARNAGVDDLGKSSGAFVGHEVEDDCLDIGTTHIPPFHMLGRELGELRCLFGNGLDGIGTMFGFLRARHIGKSEAVLLASGSGSDRMSAHCCLNQFIFFRWVYARAREVQKNRVFLRWKICNKRQ